MPSRKVYSVPIPNENDLGVRLEKVATRKYPVAYIFREGAELWLQQNFGSDGKIKLPSLSAWNKIIYEKTPEELEKDIKYLKKMAKDAEHAKQWQSGVIHQGDHFAI